MEENREELNIQDNEGTRESNEALDSREPDESEVAEYHPTAEDIILAERIAERKRETIRKKKRSRRLVVTGVIVALILLIVVFGREVIKLKAENIALKRQQEELIEERDRLSEELKNTSNKDYIKDQARKQLKLLDPGEIMFIFKDEEDTTDDGE